MRKPGRALQVLAGGYLLIAASNLYHSFEAQELAMTATEPAAVRALGDISHDSSEAALVEYGIAAALFVGGIALNRTSEE